MRRAVLPVALLLLVAAGCERDKVAPPPPAAAAEKLAPWTWHPVGGYMVIEGELAEPAHLILEGPNIQVEADVDAGPVRWEMERPALGEKADLKTADGRILARWTFGEVPKVRKRSSLPPFHPAPTPPAPTPTLAPPVAVPPLAVAWEPPPTATAVAPPSFTLPGRRAGLVLAPATIVRNPAPAVTPAPAPESRSAGPAQPAFAQAPAILAATAFPGAGEALNLVHGPRAGRKLVLTFDGGSGAESAAEILDTLKARKVRTTFFLTATFIQKYPDVVRRMAAEGHELGNHSTTHPHLAPRMQRDPKWTKPRVQAELLDADAALVRLLGRPMDPYWRAPYGEQTPEIRRWAEEIGYRHVGWSEGADSLDWATPAERKLYRSGERILDKLHGRLQRPDGGGLIVLMHLGSGRDEEDRPSKGLGAFMDRAIREGWHFASVGEYLRDLGKPVWDPAARMAWLGASGGGARPGGGLHR